MGFLDTILRSGETREDLLRAFMENVAVDPCGCWFWRGRRDAYGNFRGKPAHCVSWELHQGPIPEGLYILHGCDVVGVNERAEYGCVNPGHLRPGTPKQNSEDVQRARERARAKRAEEEATQKEEEPALPKDVIDAFLDCEHVRLKKEKRRASRDHLGYLFDVFWSVHVCTDCFEQLAIPGEDGRLDLRWADLVVAQFILGEAVNVEIREEWEGWRVDDDDPEGDWNTFKRFVGLLAIPIPELATRIGISLRLLAHMLRMMSVSLSVVRRVCVVFLEEDPHRLTRQEPHDRLQAN